MGFFIHFDKLITHKVTVASELTHITCLKDYEVPCLSYIIVSI